MKFLFLALAFASTGAIASTSFTCKELDSKQNRIVILEQIGNAKIVEGKKVPFKLTVLKTPADGSEVALVVLETEGTVETEDVMFDFTSKDKKVKFGIYMDELDQSWLKIGKAKTSRFECE